MAYEITLPNGKTFKGDRKSPLAYDLGNKNLSTVNAIATDINIMLKSNPERAQEILDDYVCLAHDAILLAQTVRHCVDEADCEAIIEFLEADA